MYTVQRSALVLHSASNMAKLVNDVDRYQEFLPWCRKSEVLSCLADQMVARLSIAMGGINQSFTTKNEMFGDERTTMSLVDGPFRSLFGVWTFKVLEANASKIELDLRFEFSNFMIEKAIGPVFKSMADSMVNSFCERADAVYQ